MYVYSFEKLEVWKLAKDLVIKIYKITSKFPSEEKFGLISQMRRASVSICSNLAEGCGRNTSKDQANFYNKAYSSLMELLNQLLISYDLNWLDEEVLNGIRIDIEKVSIKINSLRKSILKNV
jgi:four helix bundle protein